MSIYLIICLLIGASFFLTKFKARPVESYPINLELIFFNDQAVVCSDGVAVDGSIKFRLEIDREYTRDQIKKSLLEVIGDIAAKNTSYWLLCERDEFIDELKGQLSGKLSYLKLLSLEIVNLEEAAEHFIDKDKEKAHKDFQRNQIKDEVNRQIEELEKERAAEIARLEAERDAALKKVEEEVAALKAQEEEELRLFMEENERLMQEAIRKHEETKKNINEGN